MRLNFKNQCNFFYDVNAGRIDASFERTDIGAIKTGSMGKVFLRHTLLLPVVPQVCRECLS